MSCFCRALVVVCCIFSLSGSVWAGRAAPPGSSAMLAQWSAAKTHVARARFLRKLRGKQPTAGRLALLLRIYQKHPRLRWHILATIMSFFPQKRALRLNGKARDYMRQLLWLASNDPTQISMRSDALSLAARHHPVSARVRRLVSKRQRSTGIRERANAFLSFAAMDVPRRLWRRRLLQGLNHRIGLIRLRTIQGIGKLGKRGRSFVPALIRVMLRDRNYVVREVAARNLGWIARPSRRVMNALRRAGRSRWMNFRLNVRKDLLDTDVHGVRFYRRKIGCFYVPHLYLRGRKRWYNGNARKALSDLKYAARLKRRRR